MCCQRTTALAIRAYLANDRRKVAEGARTEVVDRSLIQVSAFGLVGDCPLTTLRVEQVLSVF